MWVEGGRGGGGGWGKGRGGVGGGSGGGGVGDECQMGGVKGVGVNSEVGVRGVGCRREDWGGDGVGGKVRDDLVSPHWRT